MNFFLASADGEGVDGEEECSGSAGNGTELSALLLFCSVCINNVEFKECQRNRGEMLSCRSNLRVELHQK